MKFKIGPDWKNRNNMKKNPDQDDKLELIASAALEDCGLDDNNLELIRHGTNSVYKTKDYIVRVSHKDSDLNNLVRQYNLATWLRSNNFPVPHSTPIKIIDEYPTSIWERIHTTRPANMTDLGKMVKDFHKITTKYSGELITWNPLGRLGTRLEKIQTENLVDTERLKALREIIEHSVERVAEIEFDLPFGVIHGDLHLGNVVVGESGPYLIDFDRIAFGPREWDLIPPFADIKLFSGDESSWGKFAAAYGFDATKKTYFEDILHLRSLYMFSWLFTLSKTSIVEQEIEKRFEYFLNPHAEIYRMWEPV